MEEDLDIACSIYKATELREILEQTPLVKEVRIEYGFRTGQIPVFAEWIRSNTICRLLWLDQRGVRPNVEDFFDLIAGACNNLQDLSCTECGNVNLVEFLKVPPPKLRHMELSGCVIDDATVKAITNCIRSGALRELYLDKTRISYEGWNLIFRETKHLEALDITGCHDAAFSNFVRFFGENTNLKFLNISENRFLQDSAKSFCSDVARHPSLKYFVAKCILDIPGARDCALRLVDNTRLLKISGFHCQAKTLTKRNKAAFDLCRSSSLCVAWCKHWLGRDVMRLIAKELWETRGTIFWVKDNQIIPAPVKERIVKKRKTEEDIDPDWVE